MRKARLLLLATLLLFCFSHTVYAEYQIQYDAEADRVLHLGGNTLRGHFATWKQAHDYWRSRPVFEQHHSSVVPPQQGNGGGAMSGWGGGNINTEAGAKQFLLSNMLGAILGNVFNPSSQQDDTRAQQKLLWQQKQAAIKKEKERQAALARWDELKNQAHRQKIEDQRKKEEQGKKVFAELDPVGSRGSLSMEPISGGSLETFSRGNLDLAANELQPMGSGRYDTSSLSPMKRALCAEYFSQAALAAANNGDDVKAKYLNQQAQKVMSGQMIDRECRFADLPNVPEVPKPVRVQPVSNQKTAAYYEGLIKTVQRDAKKLEDIKIKLKETDKKITEAKEKKQQAEQKISEIQKHVAMAKNPQEKQEDDKLLAAARALLQESQNEIQTASDAKQALSKQKEQAITQLQEIQKKIQPKTEAN